MFIRYHTVSFQQKLHSLIWDNFFATGPIVLRFGYLRGTIPSGLRIVCKLLRLACVRERHSEPWGASKKSRSTCMCQQTQVESNTLMSGRGSLHLTLWGMKELSLLRQGSTVMGNALTVLVSVCVLSAMQIEFKHGCNQTIRFGWEQRLVLPTNRVDYDQHLMLNS